MKLKNNTPLNSEDFKKILSEVGILDSGYSFPAIIWLPYGTRIINKISSYVREVFTEYNFDEYIFPNIINRDDFNLIDSEIYPFGKFVFKTEEGHVLKPSGESAIYPSFRRWIKSDRDLPIKMFQIGSTFRKGRPCGLFRQNESDFFIEAHTAHSSRKEASDQLTDDNKLIKKILDTANVPFLLTERPFWTNKPVAEKHIGMDCLLPSGETVLVASSYAQMQVFSKVFNVTFKNDKGVADYTYQTDMGFSNRVLLASLWLTSDENGLCIYPKISPVQIVIIEIGEKKISKYTETILERLRNLKYDVKVECVEKNKLHKIFSFYEKIGVPLRIEIGEKEKKDKTIKIVRRDNFEKDYLVLKNLDKINIVLDKINKSLNLRVKKNLRKHIIRCKTIDDVKNAIKSGNITDIFICKSKECVVQISKNVGCGEVLGFHGKDSGNCIFCGKKDGLSAYYSRRI